MKIKFSALICAVILLLSCPFAASAAEYRSDEPFDTYIYNSQNNPVAVPSAFITERVVRGSEVAKNDFNGLSDIFYDGSGKIFLCDSGNNRIVITDRDLRLLHIIGKFDFNGKSESLSNPCGVWSNGDSIYVSDTDNARIVRFDCRSFQVIEIFSAPDISVLDGDYKFVPTELTVDAAGRMYVISQGINDGLVCLNEKGEFMGFLGAPRVETDFLTNLWRKFATKSQKRQMNSYVPTEYNSVAMDSYGFIYVTSEASNTVPVAKLNCNGDNVLKKTQSGYFGDRAYLEKIGKKAETYFTDITLNKSSEIGGDIYYILDSKQGKIYAYTEDGELLYAFGANGTQKGTYYSASSVQYIPPDKDGSGRLLISDGFKNTVTVLKETEFALSIKSALDLYNGGEYEKSYSAWQNVSITASGYIPAIIGIAKIHIRNSEYKQAMKELKAIREHGLYSSAFEKSRDSFIRNNFVWFVAAFIVLVPVLIILLRLFGKSRFKEKISNSEILKGFKYGTYVMFHPFDGFWDLKHEKRGNIKSASIIAILFFLLYILRMQFGGYAITGDVSEDVNIFYNFFLMFIPIALWVVSNCCLTTLMDGKGTIAEVYTATCYALKPYVLFSIPMLICSNILTSAELPFFVFFDRVCLVWVLALFFIGLMMTHDYTLKKSVLSTVLILVGICVIIFIALLLISIVQNFWQFSYNLYQEWSFRSY